MNAQTGSQTGSQFGKQEPNTVYHPYPNQSQTQTGYTTDNTQGQTQSGYTSDNIQGQTEGYANQTGGYATDTTQGQTGGYANQSAGYTSQGGQYTAGQPATHGEAVMMLMGFASLLPPEGNGAGLQPSASFNNAHMQTAAAYGIIPPGSEGHFKPERLLTWGELESYIGRVFHVPGQTTGAYGHPGQLVTRDELTQMASQLTAYAPRDLHSLPYGDGQMMQSQRY
jgi:hypothetical protein